MLIEQNYCQYLRPGISPVNDGKNRVYLSECYEYFCNNGSGNFSIKYPVQGKVYFETGTGAYDLRPGSFLLSAGQAGKCIIESPDPVRWISIEIQRATFVEAFQLLSAGDAPGIYDFGPGHFFSEHYFENVYPIDHSDLGKILARLANLFTNGIGTSIKINSDSFLELAILVIKRELANQESLRHLSSIKNGTKKETLKRLLKGKNYIDDYFLKKPGITQIARHSNLSSFHFLRSFKLAFSFSPYQYMLQKRMEYAQSLLKAGIPITEIASACSFSDLFTFSKAFKKFFGVSPTKYLKSDPLQMV